MKAHRPFERMNSRAIHNVIAHLFKKFMEPEGSLLCSKEFATGFYPEADE
jgi:hypothetical protein